MREAAFMIFRAEAAARGGEWRGGVERLLAAPLDPQAQELIQPYVDIVAPLVSGDPPRYPGSPLIAAALLRRQDRLIACELHPAAFARAQRQSVARPPRQGDRDRRL